MLGTMPRGWGLIYICLFAAFIVTVVLIAIVTMRHARQVMDRENGFVPHDDDDEGDLDGTFRS